MASMDYGFFTDGQGQTAKGDGEITRGATSFQCGSLKYRRAPADVKVLRIYDISRTHFHSPSLRIVSSK